MMCDWVTVGFFLVLNALIFWSITNSWSPFLNIKDYSPLISPFLVSGVPFDPFHIAPNAKKEKKYLTCTYFISSSILLLLAACLVGRASKQRLLGWYFFIFSEMKKLITEQLHGDMCTSKPNWYFKKGEKNRTGSQVSERSTISKEDCYFFSILVASFKND